MESIAKADPNISSGATNRPRGHQSLARIPELDGFRAIAVLTVLIHHGFYGFPTPPESLSWLPRIPREIISHGWLGVDLFFILSGFLITGILLDTRETEHFFRNFYARRALRILPLYLTCIFIMYFAYPGHGAYFALALLFMANFTHYFHVASPHGPGVFWSLAVEEHFYLVWPLLVRFLSRSALLVTSLILVFGTPILRGFCAFLGMEPELEIYTYSFFRFDGLALGAILAIWARSPYYTRDYAWKIAGALVGLSLLFTIGGLPFGVMQTRTVASSALRFTQAQLFFAASMVLALVYRGTPYTALLRSKFAKLSSDLSYCIYLIHLCLGDFYYYLLKVAQFDDVAQFGAIGSVLARTLVIAGSSFALAALSKKYLEDPILSFKRYFEAQRA